MADNFDLPISITPKWRKAVDLSASAEVFRPPPALLTAWPVGTFFDNISDHTPDRREVILRFFIYRLIIHLDIVYSLSALITVLAAAWMRRRMNPASLPCDP